MNLNIIYTSEAAKHFYESGKLYGDDDAAGLDLRAIIDSPVCILPSEQVMIPTGLKLDLGATFKEMNGLQPELRITAFAMPRSGRGCKEGLVLGNLTGVIDQSYQGEIMLCCWARPTNGHINGMNNRVGGTPVHIEPGERIAQLVIMPVFRFASVSVKDGFEQASERGEGSFGSTGVA